jgi:alpha-tubulin suppressor-like RCC1 family protein
MPTPSEIQTCIDNLSASSEAIDFTLLAAETSNAAETLLATGISFTVATVDDLPVYSDVGLGQIFFVESIAVPVISTRSGWSGLDGRVLSGTTGTENAVFSWGANPSGALAIGTTTTICSPIREICFATNWCQVSTRTVHTTAIKTSGELWAWGTNSCGRLGDGTITNVCSPVREFCSATDWCAVSSGEAFTSAVKTSGELWGWGINFQGRLGDGTLTDRCSPVREFCSATDWCAVSSGESHTSAIKTSGELWAWGDATCGRLGDGALTIRCSPVREFCSATDWCQVSAGNLHTAAVKTSGELWGWGSNNCGQLGDGTITTRCSPVREFCSATDWCQVSNGRFHTTSVKTSGELWVWGGGGQGRLGDGTAATKCSPVREFCSATDWCAVSSGESHTLAVKTSGELWAWGCGSCGRLGDGALTIRCSPVREFCSATDWCQASAGCFHSAAIRVIA